ncbi:MAG: DNA primase [Gammaproteobacteria bacterium HGW-Gammaproteobacteria-1]|jgi:DNA primase|nr:MAG: DNA primase [Gammaproteobacteria bacterium HGW-Gammaproteobacteria-1]
MAGRIPQQFIDELISRVDIVDVIDARVPLRKKGREHVACCPFHNEKTPSFTVSQSKQFYHCFGCGAHGTALGFLMEYEHLDFVEAVEKLAAGAGLSVPREGGESAPRGPSPQPLYELMEQSAQHYQQQLRRHPQRQRAVDYLKRRGLSGEIAAAFGIGYAADGWDNLLKTLGTDKERQDRLLTVGMLIEKDDGRRYDRFRDRIMFPIRDTRGRIIAFGGRILDKGEPKYLNSPETPIFHKGRELYGLYEARQALREIPRLLVVEGYMDVVALAQFDIRYAVATLGTAVTKDHLERLFRTASEVVFCFDGDRAGRDAAWRGLENALPLMREGHQLHFMFLPEGEDPDTLVRSAGKDGFERLIDQAQPLSEYFFGQMGKQADISRLDGRARLVELCRPYLSKLPPGVYRHLMLDRLAQLAHMERDALERMLGGEAAPAAPAPAATKAKKPAAAASRHQPSLVRSAIALLLQRPALAQLAEEPQQLAGLQLPGTQLLMEMLELLRRHPHLTTGALLEHWRESDQGRHLFALAQRDMLLTAEEDNLEQEFCDTLARLVQQLRRQRRLELEQRFAELSEVEKTEYGQLLKGGG